MKLTSYKQKNGFKVICAKDSSNPLICMQLYVRIGSAWEDKNEAGFSHFTEHMVFKATEKFPHNSIMEKITYLGGHLNAYTEYDSTCYYVTLPSKHFKEGLEILSELVMNAKFNQENFNSEKKVIIEELKQFKNDPEDFFIEEIARHYFKINPYRNPIIGNIDSIQKTLKNDLFTFYKKFYTPRNCFLIVTGDFEKELLLREVKDFFCGWEGQKIKKIVPINEAFPKKMEVFSFPKKIFNDILSFVLPDLAETDPDSYVLSLISKIFSIGKNSRLYSKLFNEEKLVDSIKVHSLSGINNGASLILIMPKKKADLNKIIDIFHSELLQLQRFGLNEIEIEENKKELIYHYKYSYEYVESLAFSLGSEELLCGYENFKKYPEIIRNIKKSQIKDAIDKYYKSEHLYIFHTGMKKIDSKGIFLKLKEPVQLRISESFTGDYYTTYFDNGLKVLLKRVVGKPTIGISLSYEVSQLNENIDNRGINMMTSGLMLYGNSKRSYRQFLNYCTTNGINFGVSPKAETTSFKLKCFKEMLPISLELLSDVILTPSFPKDHLDNLKQTYISNCDRIKDYPHYLATRLWKEMIFGKKSNLLGTEGTKSTIRKFSRNQIKKWYEHYYNNSKKNLVIVGDFDFNEVLRTCEQLFSSHKKNLQKNDQNPIYLFTDKKFKKIDKNMDQSIINIGGFGCTSNERQKNTAFHVLAQIIGGDMNSLLFTDLREKKGLAYSVEFDFRSIRTIGFFLVSAIVDKKFESEAVETIMGVLDNIKRNGISQEILENTKNFILGQKLMEEESMMIRAETLSILEAIGFGYQFYLDREKRLKKVSIKDIHQIAEEYFKQENYFIHILS